MSESFASTPQEAAAWRDALDAQGKRVVFTNGCFDLLHAGHVRYLAEARSLGDALIVALNGDDSVHQLKGPGRPVNTAGDRAEILCALEAVDRVTVFDEPRVTGLIRTIRPHVYAKGGDYTVETLNPEERSALEDVGAEIHILSLVEGRSTSSLLRKVQSGEDPDPDGKLRLAVLGSGYGSNLEAILHAIDEQVLDARVALVISDVADARILTVAKNHNIPALWIDPGNSGAGLSAAAQKEILDRLRGAQVDLIALAGFMRIVKEPLLSSFAGRILNIHPSLLPKYRGLDAWKKALEAGEKESGCTVHVVDAGMDTGSVLAQASVPILEDDTPATLHARIQRQEHSLYPRVIAGYAAKLLAGEP